MSKHRLQLRLRAGTGSVGSDLPAEDIDVAYSAGATVGELRQALHGYLGAATDSAVFSGRHGMFLTDSTRLTDCGLLRGDEIGYWPRTGRDSVSRPATATTAMTLVDVEGRHAGRRTPLEAGLHYALADSKLRPSGMSDHDGVSRIDVDSGGTGTSLEIAVAADGYQLTVRVLDGTVKVDGRTVAGPASAGPGSLIQVGTRAVLRVARTDALDKVNPHGQVPFRPATRQVPRLPDPARVTAPLRPAPATKPSFPWTMVLYPVLMSGALYLTFRSMLLLVVLVITPLIAIVDWRFSLRRWKRETQAGEARHTEATKRAFEKLRAAVEEERDATDRLIPGLPDLFRRAHRKSPALWTRRTDDPDFLVVRLGYGRRASRSTFAERDDDLDDDHRQRVADITTHQRITALLPLAAHSLGIVGVRDGVRDAAWSVLVQLVTMHSPKNVRLLACLPRNPQMSTDYSWLQWLPHAQPMVPGQPAVVVGRSRSEALLADAAEAYERLADEDEPDSAPRLVVVLHEGVGIGLDVVDRLAKAASKRVSFLWLGTYTGAVPQVVSCVLEVAESGKPGAAVRVAPQGFDFGHLELDTFGHEHPAQVATSIAPLYDSREIGASAGVPSLVSLSDLRASGIALADRSLLLTLGESAAGALEVDIVRDGPHVLIGGTTGAGKSELLQSIVAGVVDRYPPAEVSLILLDFKGGATFQPFHALSHCAGHVTNLDARGGRRAMRYLRAELERRMRLFDELSTEDAQVDSYPAYRAAASSTVFVPRLLVCFDEFATLVAEDPAVMAAVVDIAQRGRSLGVHLVLATQRPSAQTLNADIRANIPLRIALRTVSEADSQLIVDSGFAAHIPSGLAGRGLLRLDAKRLVEFQAPHAGGPSGVAGDVANVEVRTLTPVVLPTATTGSATMVDSADSALRALLTEVRGRGHTRAWDQPRLWPSLDDLSVKDFELIIRTAPAADSPAVLTLGLVDDPAGQAQQPYRHDLRSGALLVCGGLGSGKTETMKVALGHYPGAVRVVIDAGGRDLADHANRRGDCAVVVSGANTDLLCLCLDQIQDELTRRQEGQGEAFPILVVIDDIAAAAEPFEPTGWAHSWQKYVAQLADIISLGRMHRIHVVASCNRLRDLSPTLRGLFSTVVQLGVADVGDDLTEGKAVGLRPGRGVDRSGLDLRFIRADAPLSLKAATARLLGYPLRAASPDGPEPYVVNIGTDDRTHDDVPVDLRDGSLMIVGRRGSGKTTTLVLLADHLAKHDLTPTVLVGNPRRGELWRRSPYGAGLLTPGSADALVSRINEIAQDAKPGRPVPILVDDGWYLYSLPGVATTLEERMLEGKLALVVATHSADATRWQAVFDQRRILFLRPLPVVQSSEPAKLVGANYFFRPGQRFGPGSAWYFDDGREMSIRVPAPGLTGLPW